MIGSIAIAYIGIVGCESMPKAGDSQATSAEVAQMLDPNVVGVTALYDSYDPWLWTKSRSKPIGVIIRALYLQGPNYKGVFGDGIIRPKLYVQRLTETGEKDWELAKEWSFTVEQAIRFRSKRQTMLGWGYMLHLPWGDLNLAGREIRMMVEFERSDGHNVNSYKKDFRVPGSPSDTPGLQPQQPGA